VGVATLRSQGLSGYSHGSSSMYHGPHVLSVQLLSSPGHCAVNVTDVGVSLREGLTVYVWDGVGTVEPATGGCSSPGWNDVCMEPSMVDVTVMLGATPGP